MQYLPLIHTIMPLVIQFILALALLVRSKEIFALITGFFATLKEIISNEHGRGSSRRVIAIAASYTFFHLAMYCQYTQTEPNLGVMVFLIVIIFLGLGFATFPQLLQAWGYIRGLLLGVNIPQTAGAGEAGKDNLEQKQEGPK